MAEFFLYGWIISAMGVLVNKWIAMECDYDRQKATGADPGLRTWK